jgi:hypothetical protein
MFICFIYNFVCKYTNYIFNITISNKVFLLKYILPARMKKVILPAKRLDGIEKQWLSRNEEKISLFTEKFYK